MAVKNNIGQLDAPAVPALPVAPDPYSRAWGASLLNTLRLYFNLITSTLKRLFGPLGGRYLAFPHGAFYDTTNQYDGSTTIPYAVRLNTTAISNGVTITNREFVGTASIALTTMTVTAIASGRLYPSMLLSGSGVTAGAYVYLQLSSTAAPVATPTWVSGGAIGATTFVVSSVVGVEDRQFVSGTGVPANTRVIHVDTATNTVTLSAAFTVQAAGTYTFRPWGYQGTYSVSPSQTVASTTVSGVLSSMITAGLDGTYNIQFSFQFANTSATAYDVDIWLKKNDVTIPDSNSQFTVPGKHGSINGHLIAALNYFVDMLAGDVIEIVWRTENSTVFIEYIPPQASPIRPATPSAIVTVNFVSSLAQ